IQFGYDQFISKVANHRDSTVDEIDAVARGRVWIAADAQNRGLVDRLGNLDDAVSSAADLAGLEEDSYELLYLERELEFAERVALELATLLAPFTRGLGIEWGVPDEFRRVLDAVSQPLQLLDRLNDPRDIYAYCFCDIR
ncbi:MAG: S49 family peptidase, partial [Gammaproteobacteria bacterium]